MLKIINKVKADIEFINVEERVADAVRTILCARLDENFWFTGDRNFLNRILDKELLAVLESLYKEERG